MNIRKFVEKDYPRILEIYAGSKLDELRFESRPYNLLPLEEDKKRLSSLKESEIFVANSNTPAKNLYEGYGFVVTNEFQTSYNGEPVLVNEMTRP